MTRTETTCRLAASTPARSSRPAAGRAWASSCRRCSRPPRSRVTPACRDIAAARAGRAAGFAPGPAGGSRSRAGGSGRSRPSSSPARRPVIRASVREFRQGGWRRAPRSRPPPRRRRARGVRSARPGRPDAAAGVVRARCDRDRLGRRVDPARPAQPGHRREIPFQRGPAQPGRVQPEMVGPAVPALLAGLDHPLLHGRRHDVPGGQVAARVPPSHHRLARRVHQHRTGPAQRLGDQRALALGPGLPQHRRVELHELHVPQSAPAGRPAPGRPRSARPGRWWSRTPGRSRRSRARPRGRSPRRPAGLRRRPTIPASIPPTGPGRRSGVQRDTAG